MEQLDCNLLFRWSVGLGMDDAVWSPSTFTKNRDRLLDGESAAAFFDAVLIHADTERLLSDDHFTVDGTLVGAWASRRASGRAIKTRGRRDVHDHTPGDVRLGNNYVETAPDRRSRDARNSRLAAVPSVITKPPANVRV